MLRKQKITDKKKLKSAVEKPKKPESPGLKSESGMMPLQVLGADGTAAPIVIGPRNKKA